MNAVVFKPTGRYWLPFVRDVTKRDPWVERRGGEFWPRPDARTGTPPDGLPHLLLFPPPYHPIEMLMCWRGGYGGFYPQFSFKDINTIDATRQDFKAFMVLATKVLHWPPNTARVIYHICTPVRNENGGGPDLTKYRERLGVPPPVPEYGLFPYPLFWGEIVKGDAEL